MPKIIFSTQTPVPWLEGNKFHEGIGQALHYGDVTGQQPVLARTRAHFDIYWCPWVILRCTIFTVKHHVGFASE